MINIYRSDNEDCALNVFAGRANVSRHEIVVKTKEVFGQSYTYVEPVRPGQYAFGGNLCYTSNGIFPEFTVPLKLHDRDMNLEGPND